jgi:hypothetical protein
MFLRLLDFLTNGRFLHNLCALRVALHAMKIRTQSSILVKFTKNLCKVSLRTT